MADLFGLLWAWLKPFHPNSQKVTAPEMTGHHVKFTVRDPLEVHVLVTVAAA